MSVQLFGSLNHILGALNVERGIAAIGTVMIAIVVKFIFAMTVSQQSTQAIDMTVKQLIKELRKMPKDLDVGMVAFDLPAWCVGDWVCSVEHIIKDEVHFVDGADDERIYNDMPAEYVIVHG